MQNNDFSVIFTFLNIVLKVLYKHMILVKNSRSNKYIKYIPKRNVICKLARKNIWLKYFSRTNVKLETYLYNPDRGEIS